MAITGVSGALGQRVADRLAAAGHEVVGADVRLPPNPPAERSRWRFHWADVRTADLGPVLDGADVVIHLASVPVDTAGSAAVNVAGARRVLDAAAAAGTGRVVLVSSAAVYGAWPDNPVPLTEDATLRPSPGFTYAVQKAELERLASEWRADHPGTPVAVLRPARTLGPPGTLAWLADTTRPRLADRLSHTVPALQYVHVDDVADAVAHAAQAGLDGVFNVGPDGWMGADQAAALHGPTFEAPVPDRLARVLSWLTRFLGRDGVPGSEPYRRHTWVVASDRLKATGWSPRSTSEETLVASRAPSRLSRFAARHRQEVTMAVVGVLALSVAGTVGGLLWRRRRRRQRA